MIIQVFCLYVHTEALLSIDILFSCESYTLTSTLESGLLGQLWPQASDTSLLPVVSPGRPGGYPVGQYRYHRSRLSTSWQQQTSTMDFENEARAKLMHC
jgi:hypothetical protein